MQHAGFDAEQLAQLTMPIGLAEVGGKLPMEVAVSIAAQLLARKTAQVSARKTAQASAGIDTDKSRRKGLSWKHMQEGLASNSSLQPQVDLNK